MVLYSQPEAIITQDPGLVGCLTDGCHRGRIDYPRKECQVSVLALYARTAELQVKDMWCNKGVRLTQRMRSCSRHKVLRRRLSLRSSYRVRPSVLRRD